MQKKTDKFLEKLVKKNYNNELEEILEKKNFEENTKSILLNILYKIEAAYKDYEKVKQEVEPKEEFISSIIETIKHDCEDIKIVKLHSEESELLGSKTFLVDKKLKRIICYPIERKVLYCISKISKKDKIIKNEYYLVNRTLSDLINVGNNINTVEPMRDFNGYSWTTLPREIESINHNLIYQNLRILLGYKFLNNWIRNREYIIDYMELLKIQLEEKYGETTKKEFLEVLNKLSVLLSIKYDEKTKKAIVKEKVEVEQEIERIGNNQEFVDEITKQKKALTEEIKRIDETMNNKDMLQKEYENRNKNLPLEEKIFSIRILSKMMIDERDEKIKKIEELNELLNPKKFVKYKNKLENKEKYLKLIEVKNIENEIEKQLQKFQKIFLKCYKEKINKAETKQEIIKLIYEFRYYCLLPFNQDISVNQVESLEKEIETVERKLISKAHQIKAIDIFSKNEEFDYQILKLIFRVRVISLEDLYIKIIKEKEKYYIQLFDENIFEEKIEAENLKYMDKKDLEIKLNKKVNIFN